MRYVFSALGEFFRQYFFAMDREELPFNRAERSWIERASKNGDSTVAFGSTKYIKEAGTPIFVNCPYPRSKRISSPRRISSSGRTRQILMKLSRFSTFPG
jgi:hypothetical protein